MSFAPDLQTADSSQSDASLGFRGLRDPVQTGALQDFVWIAAHQLKTPLAIMQARVANGNRLCRRKILTDIDRMRRLLDQLLVVALSESGRATDAKPVDLNVLVRSAAKHFMPMLRAKNCELSVAVPATPTMVNAHFGLCFEALSNLIDNAVKYGGPYSEITVEVDADGSVAVSDSGPGISEDVADRLFTGFITTSKTVANGAGLGLYIVHRVMQAHGGSVEHRRSADGRTTLVMRFPDIGGASGD